MDSTSSSSSSFSYMPSTSTNTSNSYSYPNQNYSNQNYSSSSSSNMPSYDNHFYTQQYPSSSSSSSSSPSLSSPLTSNAQQQQQQPHQDQNSYYFNTYNNQSYYPQSNFNNNYNDFNSYNNNESLESNSQYGNYYYPNDQLNWSSNSQSIMPQYQAQDYSQNFTNFPIDQQNTTNSDESSFLIKKNKAKSSSKLSIKGPILKRKSKDVPRRSSIRPNMCQHGPQLNDIDCEYCKYEKSLKLGIPSTSTKLKEPKSELDIFDSYTELSNYTYDQIDTNLKQVNSYTLNEIENKKHLIRTAQSELKVKEYILDLIKNLINIFHNGKSLNLNEIQYQDKVNPTLLAAYSYLIDQDSTNPESSVLLLLTCQLSPYELKLLDQLQKIYSNNQIKPYYENYGYFGNNDSNYYSNYMGYESSKNCDLLKELKIFHFLLILFSSFQNLDQFMQMNTATSTIQQQQQQHQSNIISTSSIQDNIDAVYCQKLILKMIDNVCKDKVIKTKILLSVSDFELI
ncbi:unnamed protein product [Brachionus calyciflorus]|uniref:Uncharacterized protein n=1 Tax=Brachionus calyciflorus TaxID=104777 RepID=A0A814FT47_9BILA|nr:unnamed protein product [Brachionus calyciflorus]